MKTKIWVDMRNRPRPIRSLLHRLDKPGIFDSLTRTIRGESITAYKDYGLISLVKKTFSKSNEDFWIIYVAGVHGPGTARGLKLLCENEAFKDHPYGGVYEVKIDRFADYFEKFHQSRARWETLPYVENRFGSQDFNLDTVRAFLSSPAGKDDEHQKQFNRQMQSLLLEIYENMAHRLEIEEPFSLAIGADIDFWRSIFDYHKTCHFIVHDLTDCAFRSCAWHVLDFCSMAIGAQNSGRSHAKFAGQQAMNCLVNVSRSF